MIPCQAVADPVQCRAGNRPERQESRHPMRDEKIPVRVTATGDVIEVVVLRKRVDRIEVVVGQGIHNVRCELTPTRNRLAYAGTVMGREIVYERTPEQVQADIDRLNPALKKSRP